VSNGASLETKLLHLIACQLGLEYFDSRLRAKIDMFTQVDLGEATFSQEAYEAVIPKVLPNTFCHRRVLSSSNATFLHYRENEMKARNLSKRV